MAIEIKSGRLWIALASFGLLIAILVSWLNQGYGKVSSRTYEISMALYRACHTRNEVQLSRVEELLDIESEDPIPDHERHWLRAIVADARDGRWQRAADQARRIMEEQVSF